MTNAPINISEKEKHFSLYGIYSIKKLEKMAMIKII